MKTVSSEKCNMHIVYHSVKSIFPEIICKNRIPRSHATKKNDTEQTFT